MDAQKVHRLHPETFEVPTQEELNTIRAGDHVKLCFNNKERMWVEVVGITDTGVISGIVDNKPVCEGSPKYKHPVVFCRENVYNILKAQENREVKELCKMAAIVDDYENLSGKEAKRAREIVLKILDDLHNDA